MFKDFNIPQVGQQTPPVVDATKPDPIKEYVDAIVQAKQKIAVIDALNGVMNPTKPPVQSSELTGSAIITKSIDVLEKQNQRVQEAVEKRDKDVEHARAEADKAKAEVLSITAQQIAAAMEKLDRIRDEMKGGSQKSLLEQLNEAKQIGVILNPPAPAVKPPESDLSAAMALEKMREVHELEMKKLDIQLNQMQNDLKIKLAEMTDTRQWREREWEEGRDFKKNALAQVSDVAAGIAAAFQAKKGGGLGSRASEPPPAADENISAVIKSFPCQKCGGEVAIPEDAEEVLCPTPGCGLKYSISRQEAE